MNMQDDVVKTSENNASEETLTFEKWAENFRNIQSFKYESDRKKQYQDSDVKSSKVLIIPIIAVIVITGVVALVML